MRIFAMSLMLVGALIVGCNTNLESPETVTPTSGETDSGHDHGHEHGEEGHDHGHGGHAEGEHSHESEGHESEGHDADAVGHHEEGDGKGHDNDSGHDDNHGAANSTGEMIRFVADSKIEVPGMMCPYSCWPRVKETLASQPGVEAVQLAEQPEGTKEGEIVERVVELKLTDEFNSKEALAALGKINFEAKVMN